MTVQFSYFATHRNLQSQVNGSYKTDGAREGKHYSTLFLENKIMMIVNKSCNTTKMVKKVERTDATTVVKLQNPKPVSISYHLQQTNIFSSEQTQ